LGFDRLERIIERSEQHSQPRYGKARLTAIAKAAAGKVYRQRQARRTGR